MICDLVSKSAKASHRAFTSLHGVCNPCIPYNPDRASLAVIRAHFFIRGVIPVLNNDLTAGESEPKFISPRIHILSS